MSALRQEILFNCEIVSTLCNYWHERISDPAFNPGSVLNKLSEILETEMKIYREIYPHPFDHNKKSILKQLTILDMILDTLVHSKIELIQKLINDYLKNNLWPTRTEDNHNLNIAACRLLINFSFGINFKSIFSKLDINQIIQKLLPLANNPCVLLHTYAVGLLAMFIKISKNSIDIREQNLALIPKILNRLHDNVMFCEDNIINQNSKIFSQLNNDIKKIDNNNVPHKSSNNENPSISDEDSCQNIENDLENSSNEPILEDVCDICKDSSSLAISKTKSSDWIEIYPLTSTTKSYFDLKYLYQITRLEDDLSRSYEEKFLNLILKIINSSKKLNIYFNFEILKFMNLFLYQQSNMAIELVMSEILQKLLLIPKQSINSTGVLMCFYRMLLYKEGMEKICLISKRTLVDLVKYELWMLKHSSCLNKRYVFLFFRYSFQFREILNIFDNSEGLFEIIDVVRSLPILQSNSVTDRSHTNQELIYYSLLCLKEYFVAHLKVKVEDTSIMVHNDSSTPNYITYKSSEAEVLKKIELLSNSMSINSHWTPVDKFVKFKGLGILLEIVFNCLNFHNFFINRYFIIKIALEVINICAILPKVQLLLCEPLSHIQTSDPPAENDNIGIGILMKTKINCSGNEFSAATKALLSIILTCVCAPLHWGKGSMACNSVNEASKKPTHTNDNDVVIEKIWDCIRNNHGIMILLDSITTDEHTEEHADEIRELACRALAGLARSETVYKIISKWPIFNSDQLKKYFTNHHAPCEQPRITCRALHLTDSHKFSDPKPKSLLCTNFAMRFSKNVHSRRQDQRLIFSRFSPSFKFDCSEETHYLCCEFLKLNRIAVGTNAGDIIVINTYTRQEELLLRTPHDYITNLECSNDEKLFVTSSGISSAIWTISDTLITQKYSLDEHYCKLSNTYQTKLLGTRNEVATIYDVETSNKIMTLVPRLSNKYKRNQAVFDATNALVLSDGVLWDANAGIKIHKFEKLNMNLNGVFHPNGLEIISNSEVWDLRTFGLLYSVSDLNQCNVMFSKTGKGMYSYAFDSYDNYLNLQSSFKSFDPFDYSTLTEVPTKHKIVQMCCDKYDTNLGVIELLSRGSMLSSYLKLFDIGMVKQFYN